VPACHGASRCGGSPSGGRRSPDAPALAVAALVVVERKLLEKKEGKKRMRQFGKVEIPQEAFIQALKMDS
jgi:hypothetical protein